VTPIRQYAAPPESDAKEPDYCRRGNIRILRSVGDRILSARHGHVAVAVPVAELQRVVLLMYGGETTYIRDMRPADMHLAYSQVSSQVHVAVFETHPVSLSLPALSDVGGRSCTLAAAACAPARRDAAAVLVDGGGGSNGHFFMFGGMTARPDSNWRDFTSLLRAYMHGDGSSVEVDGSSVEALDDVWSLDLSDLSFGCDNMPSAVCLNSVLQWVRVSVGKWEGGGMSLWGATMVLDSVADALVVFGGTSLERPEDAGADVGERIFVHHDRAFSLLLRQTSASRCNMIRASTRAQAGVTTRVTVRCADVVGRPTSAARISATFRGPENLEPLCELGDGSWAPAATTLSVFVCRITAFTTGSYQVSVFVPTNSPSLENTSTDMQIT